MAEAQPVHIFQQYVEKTITVDQFVTELQKLTTQVQMKELSDYQAVQDWIEKIDDDVISQQIELFTKFALHISDRGIYAHLENKNFDFKLCQPNHQSVLGLYIISRVSRCESNKVLSLFLNPIIRELKSVEKKFVLLEIYIHFLSTIDKREVHFQDILPLILLVINDGLQRYYRYVKEKKEGDFSSKGRFAHDFYNSFQRWTLNIFKRIFSNLLKTPEIQSQSKKAVQELQGVSDLYDYDSTTDQVYRKPENPKLAVKHLALMFVCDLIQGIIEARLSAATVHLEISILDELLELSIGFLEAVHNNQYELIENYIQGVRFNTQREFAIDRKYQRFLPDMLYNPVAMNYLVWSNLFRQKTENRNNQQIFTVHQKLKLAFGVLFENKLLTELKNDIVDKVLQGIVELLATQKLDVKISSPSHFMTRLDVVVLRILEKAGTGLPKDQEQLYLTAWRNLTGSCTLQCQASIVVASIKSTENIPLLSHQINNFRSALIAEAREAQPDQYENIYKIVAQLQSEVTKKTSSGTIDSKISLVDAIILLMKALIMVLKPKNKELASKYLSQWEKPLKQFEKDIQHSLDYLNQKKQQQEKKQEQEKDFQSEQVYYQLLGQENQIQIAYYNLQDLKALAQES